MRQIIIAKTVYTVDLKHIVKTKTVETKFEFNIKNNLEGAKINEYKPLKVFITKLICVVVGGGLAGMCAAVAAARHGIKVALMHDRPVYGGNASSEIRMWVCGAHGKNKTEKQALLRKLHFETLYRNPYRRYPMWDAILV